MEITKEEIISTVIEIAESKKGLGLAVRYFLRAEELKEDPELCRDGNSYSRINLRLGSGWGVLSSIIQATEETAHEFALPTAQFLRNCSWKDLPNFSAETERDELVRSLRLAQMESCAEISAECTIRDHYRDALDHAAAGMLLRAREQQDNTLARKAFAFVCFATGIKSTEDAIAKFTLLKEDLETRDVSNPLIRKDLHIEELERLVKKVSSELRSGEAWFGKDSSEAKRRRDDLARFNNELEKAKA